MPKRWYNYPNKRFLLCQGLFEKLQSFWALSFRPIFLRGVWTSVMQTWLVINIRRSCLHLSTEPQEEEEGIA